MTAPRFPWLVLSIVALLARQAPTQGSCGTPNWTTTVAQKGAHYGWSICDLGDVNADGYADVMVGAPLAGGAGRFPGSVFAYYGSSTGLRTTADWRADGDLPSISFGHAIAGIGDVNGDGVDDVAVSAPGYNGGAGAVFVWHGQSGTGLNGGVTGAVVNAAWRCDGIGGSMRLGHSIAACDVNGDGINDLIVGAPGFSNSAATPDEGAVFIWYGSTTGLHGGVHGNPTNADWMAEGDFLSGKLGITVAAAGDMTGDGIDDFAITAQQAPGYPAFSGFTWVFHGAPGGPAPGLAAGIPVGGGDTNYAYGRAMAAGDFDDDGLDELAIGIPGFTGSFNAQGAVTVVKGAAALPVWTRLGETHNEKFGDSLATGDHDADGFDDLLVGSPLWSNLAGGTGVAGQINLFSGDALLTLIELPAVTCSGSQSQAQFGFAVAMADVDSDGAADRLVSTPYYDSPLLDQGAAWMWRGVPGAASVRDHCVNPVPDLTIEAPVVANRHRSHFARFLANAGDVNGDGVDDVIASGPGYGASEGVVFVFHGGFVDPQGRVGLDPNPAFTFRDPSLMRLGTSVAAAGDVNGDGFDDVIVGATGWGPNYQYRPGGAWLFYGGPNGLDPNDPTKRWTATSPLVPDQFGFSVAGVGDVNGDGFDDVMVGAIGCSPTTAAGSSRRATGRAGSPTSARRRNSASSTRRRSPTSPPPTGSATRSPPRPTRPGSTRST